MTMAILEQTQFEKHQVHDEVPTEECHKETGTVLTEAKWVASNEKSDKIHLYYRSKLAANMHMIRKGEMSAITFPIKAQRMLLLFAANEGIEFTGGLLGAH